MHGRIGFGLSAALLWAIALVACSAAPPPSPTPPSGEGAPPSVGTAGDAVVASPPAMSADPGAAGAPRACKLPAPKKSGDACKADADCGPSALCHAPACVARAKSPPKSPNTMCTESYGCDTADANRCGCYEGTCALIPPP